jgi:hypothetical protein
MYAGKKFTRKFFRPRFAFFSCPSVLAKIDVFLLFFCAGSSSKYPAMIYSEPIKVNLLQQHGLPKPQKVPSALTAHAMVLVVDLECQSDLG